MTLMPHRFRPPKKLDLKKWEVVEFLVLKGFKYGHVYRSVGKYAKYPETMKDALEFVEKYKSQLL